MPKKKKEKTERVTTTNIKVTVDTHRELQVAAEMLNTTQSEAISMALRSLLPNLVEVLRRREEERKSAAERASRLNKN